MKIQRLYCLIAGLALLLSTASHALEITEEQHKNNISEFNEYYRSKGKMGSNETFVKTRYPLIYAVQEENSTPNERAKKYAPRYIVLSAKTDEEMTSINLDNRGFSTTLRDGKRRNEIIAERNLLHFKYLPFDKLIRVNYKTNPVAIIYSAPDCPYCLSIEKDLKDLQISYYVIPTWLSENNKRFVVSAYCSDAPAENWIRLMSRQPITGKLSQECSFPKQDFDDIHYPFSLMARGSTPMIIFADGETPLSGYDSSKDKQKFLAKIKAGIFFK